MKKIGILSLREKIGFALGDSASNFYWKVHEFFILIFYTDIFGISPAQAGTMFVVARLWDGINDPVMGMISDRTNSRWGRFRPYLLWLAIPLSVVGVFAFTTPDFSDGGNKLAYAYATYILLWMTYTAINIPYSALMGVITPDTQERVQLSSFRFTGAFIVSLLVSTYTLDLVNALGPHPEVEQLLEVEGSTRTQFKPFTDKDGFDSIHSTSGDNLLLLGEGTNGAFAQLNGADDKQIKAVLVAYDEPENAAKSLKAIDQTVLGRHQKEPSDASEKDGDEAPPGELTQLASGTWSGATIVDNYLIFILASPAKEAAEQVIAAVRNNCIAPKKVGWQRVMGLYGVFAIILFWICFAQTRERVKPSAKQQSNIAADWGSLLKNGPWFWMFFLGICVITAFVLRGATLPFYFQYYLNDGPAVGGFFFQGGLASLAGIVSMPYLTRFISKHRLYMICMGSAAIAQIPYYFIAPESTVAIYSLNILICLLLGPTAPLMFAMYTDVADYGEWKTGRRCTGLVMAAAMLALKVGGSVGGGLNGWILESFGYVANQPQTGTSITGIKLLISVFPAGICLLAACMVLFYKLDDKFMRQIEADLKERKGDDLSEKSASPA